MHQHQTLDRHAVTLERGEFLDVHQDRTVAGEADDGALCVIREAVEVQHVFHPRQVLARDLPDAPLLLEVRLQFVFFSTALTVLCEIAPTKPSSTALSASSRSVQRA